MNVTELTSTLSVPELLKARQAWEQRIRNIASAPVYLRGSHNGGSADMYEDPVGRMQQALEALTKPVERLRDMAIFRPVSVDSGLHGVHFVDKILGAEVYELDGESGNWQARSLDTPVGDLEMPDMEANPTWATARAFATAFVESGVTVPVFMLPTIASALNIAMNLYGQDFLLSMLSDPEAARHDLEVINSVLLEIHSWYRTTVPEDSLHQVCCSGRYQPPGCGQICGCSTQLVSQEQYREFIAPHDDAVLSLYPNGGMIHLCGTHTQHIPAWRDMASLTAVQVNDRAAEDLEIYLRDMPDKTYYVNPCEGMPLSRIQELARNAAIVIVSEPKPPST